MRLHQPVLFTEKGAVIQPQKRKSESKRRNLVRSAHFFVCRESLTLVHFCYNVLVFNCDSKLPIVPFAGQHFSGSLFYAITLLLLSRERTKGTRVRGLQPLTLSLRFSPSRSHFPYSHPYPARVLAIRHTNDWVLKACISGSLTLT